MRGSGGLFQRRRVACADWRSYRGSADGWIPDDYRLYNMRVHIAERRSGVSWFIKQILKGTFEHKSSRVP